MNAQHASRYVLLVDCVCIIGFVCKSITSNKEDDNYVITEFIVNSFIDDIIG